LIGRSRRLLDMRQSSGTVNGGCPAPEPGTHGRTPTVQPPPGIGRDEGTDTVRGRRGQRRSLGNRHPHGASAAIRVGCRHVASASTNENEVSTRGQRLPAPGPTQRKKRQNPLLGIVCLLTTGGLIGVRLRRGLRSLHRYCAFSSLTPPCQGHQHPGDRTARLLPPMRGWTCVLPCLHVPLQAQR
jgi:hypothetical protein